MSLTIGSLFSGYSGLDMGVNQVVDARPAWFVEYDEAPARVLAHHFPGVPNYGDVTTLDWEELPPVDVITGGFPCQPFSRAGQRKGTNDERHLWPYVWEAVRVLRPRFAFLENVPGLRSMGLSEVLSDLASIGFDAWWTTVRASDVGAPHDRERVFILACPADADSIGLETQRLPSGPAEEVAGDHDGHDALAWFGGPAGVEREARLRWGDAGLNIARWALAHGDPPPVITEQVTYHCPELFGTRFPEHKPGINPEFVEWLMGLPEGWVTGVEGLSRADRLKMLGNGVVPDQGAAALTQLLEMKEQEMEAAA